MPGYRDTLVLDTPIQELTDLGLEQTYVLDVTDTPDGQLDSAPRLAFVRTTDHRTLLPDTPRHLITVQGFADNLEVYFRQMYPLLPFTEARLDKIQRIAAKRVVQALQLSGVLPRQLDEMSLSLPTRQNSSSDYRL